MDRVASAFRRPCDLSGTSCKQKRDRPAEKKESFQTRGSPGFAPLPVQVSILPLWFRVQTWDGDSATTSVRKQSTAIQFLQCPRLDPSVLLDSRYKSPALLPDCKVRRRVMIDECRRLPCSGLAKLHASRIKTTCRVGTERGCT